MTAPGEAAVGMVLRFERSPYSPYQGPDRSSDFLPYFVYDSQHFYLQSDRIGL